MYYLLAFTVISAALRFSDGSLNVRLSTREAQEGSTIDFQIISNQDDFCKFQSSDPTQGMFFPIELQFTANEEKVMYFEALIDNVADGDQEVALTAFCKNFTKVFFFKFKAIDDLIDEIVGDPHIIQTVVDTSTGENRKICYDVTGKAGDYIEIYKHRQSDTRVLGQLMDDYYMHRIIISNPGCNVTVANEQVLLNDKKLLSLTDSTPMRVYKNMKCSIYISKNEINVQSHNANDFGGVGFHVTRSIHKNIGHFFNVNVDGLSIYKGVEGLLGRVGNSKFRFYNSVQDNKAQKGAVVVNGHFTTVTKEKRDGLSCWLMDVKAIISPLPISNFVLESKENIY